MAAAEPEAEIDGRFEYDAPMWYDFDEGSPAGEGPADRWFDTDGPKGLATPEKPQSEQQEGSAATAAAAGTAENVNPQAADAGGKAGGSKGKEWRRALASISNNTASAAAAAGKQAQQAAGGKQGKRKAAAAAGEEPASAGPSAAAPAAAKSRPASARQQQQQQPRERPASRQEQAAARQAAPPSSEAAASRRVPACEPQPQHARQPPAARRRRSPRLEPSARPHPHQGGEAKTSEQLELERVQAEKEEAAALRRRNAEAVKHVLGAPPPPVVHSSRALTEPVALELCTSKRRRMHSMETRSMGSPYKSMAEQIAAFEGRLPGKSRLGGGEGPGSAAAAPAAAAHGPSGHQHHGQHSLTVPHSPRFATKKRVRPPRFKPREVVEAEEMAAMPKFKARPVNKRIMQDRTGQLGVRHVDAKPPTVPEPFALKTDRRAVEHGGSEDHLEGHGQPGSSGAGGVFVFGAAGGEGGRVTRRKAKRAGAAGGWGSGWTGQLTQPEPFHLATDARGASKRSAAAEPHQEAQHARPAKKARRGQQAAAGPFQLATDARGAAEEARLEGIRQQQEEQARREAEFKALPLNRAALAGAWKPPPSAPSALTVPVEVSLHSDARAERRRAFDEAFAAKQAEMEADRQHLLEEQAAAEERELQEHRRRLGHKALPLPDRL